MLKNKKVLLLMMISSTQAAFSAHLFNQRAGFVPSSCTVSLVTLAMYAGNMLQVVPNAYKTLEEIVSNKINEHIIDSLILLLTPICYLNKLVGEDREKKFNRKAYLLSAKTRIITSLQSICNDQHAKLSYMHREQLKTNIEKAKAIFDWVDFIDKGASWLFEVPKLEYKDPRFIDKMIEDRLVSSIVISSKPLAECTEQEKLDRANNRKVIKRLIIKKIGHLSEEILIQIDQMISVLFP